MDNSLNPVFGGITVSATQPDGAQDLVAQKTGNEYVPKTPEIYNYDVDGNLVGDGRWTYTWDGENRLIGMVAIPSVPAPAKLQLAFLYDGFGRRIQKTVSTWDAGSGNYTAARTLRFVYDGWNLLTELDGTNQPLRSYVWGLDVSGSLHGGGGILGLLLERDITGQNSYMPAYDGNGNVLSLISVQDGSVAAKYEYGPFGEVIEATGSVAMGMPFRFSTKFTDNETGLVNYGYRFYSSQTGRWVGRDPIEEAGGYNINAFAFNAPASYLDTLGLEPSIVMPPLPTTIPTVIPTVIPFIAPPVVVTVAVAGGVGLAIGGAVLVAVDSYAADVDSEAAMVRAEIDKEVALKKKRPCRRCTYTWEMRQRGGDVIHNAIATKINGGISAEMVITDPFNNVARYDAATPGPPSKPPSIVYEVKTRHFWTTRNNPPLRWVESRKLSLQTRRLWRRIVTSSIE